MTGKAFSQQLDLKETAAGVLLSVRAMPGSSRDKVLGIHANALKIAVCAPSIEGKANKALIRILAKKLGVKRSCVNLYSGKTSRNKCFLLENLGKKEAEKMIAEALPPEKRSR